MPRDAFALRLERGELRVEVLALGLQLRLAVLVGLDLAVTTITGENWPKRSRECASRRTAAGSATRVWA